MTSLVIKNNQSIYRLLIGRSGQRNYDLSTFLGMQGLLLAGLKSALVTYL